jgi:hypothetical protein
VDTMHEPIIIIFAALFLSGLPLMLVASSAMK